MRSSLSLLQAEQTQFSQPISIGEVLQPHSNLCGPLQNLLQQLHILLVLWVPDLDTGLPMGLHKGRVERNTPLPLPAAILLMQPRIQPFWLASAHYWSLSSFSSIRTPIYLDMYLCTCRFVFACVFIWTVGVWYQKHTGPAHGETRAVLV